MMVFSSSIALVFNSSSACWFAPAERRFQYAFSSVGILCLKMELRSRYQQYCTGTSTLSYDMHRVNALNECIQEWAKCPHWTIVFMFIIKKK